MTEDVSDNFSIDSLEEDGRETDINLPIFGNQTKAVEEEVSEVSKLNDSGTTSDGKSSKYKPCTFYVPFYSGNTHVSDIRKIKKFNVRPSCDSKEMSKLVLPEGAVKKCQQINALTESCQRVERWRTNVQSSKNIVISESNRKDLDNFHSRKERSQSLIPITRSMANMKLYEHTKKPSKSISGDPLESHSTGFCSGAASKKQKTLLQNKKCVSYLDQYRLNKYGKHHDKCQRLTPTEAESRLFTQNSVTDLGSILQKINANREYSEDSGVSYMQMIDDGLDLENVDESTYCDQYKMGRNCELDTTVDGGLHMSSEQLCTKSKTKLENDENKNAHKFAPYTINEYRLLLPTKLGKLGPDVAANKEKVDQLLKRLEYGELASGRNRELIRLKNKKVEKIAASKSASSVTNSLSESKKHEVTTNLPLKSQHANHKNRTMKSEVNMKLLSVASISNPEMKETVQSRNARGTRNDSQTEKKKEIKSNREMIIKMQERHRKEIEIIENI